MQRREAAQDILERRRLVKVFEEYGIFDGSVTDIKTATQHMPVSALKEIEKKAIENGKIPRHVKTA